LAPFLTLPPISPFDMSITITSPCPSPPLHHRALSRSYSERTAARSANEASHRRPVTANPSLPSDWPVSQHSANDPGSTPEASPTSTSSARRPQKPVSSQHSSRPRSLTIPSLWPRSSLTQLTSFRPLLSGGPSAVEPLQDPRLKVGSNSPNEALKLPASMPGGAEDSAASPRPSSSRSSISLHLQFTDNGSPELYLHRLQATVSKAEVATILASRYIAFLCLCLPSDGTYLIALMLSTFRLFERTLDSLIFMITPSMWLFENYLWR
jgi:hypothetical protein